MEEKKKLIRHYNAKKVKLEVLLEIFNLSKHRFYQKLNRTGKPRSGRPSDKVTPQWVNGKMVNVCNGEVVELMRLVQLDADLRCGRDRMTALLQLVGYIINHKKVGALMKRHKLSLKRVKRNARSYVKFKVPKPTRPLTHIQMDIKQVWVGGISKRAFVLTLIDVFTRKALVWKVGHTMNQSQIKQAIDELIKCHLQPNNTKALHIEIRNDNGPQFSATMVQAYLKENGLTQVFTHPYTPEENGHIESFHAILARSLDGIWFRSIFELENRLHSFYEKYNNVRIHASTAMLPPAVFELAFDEDLIKKNNAKTRPFKLKTSLETLLGNPNLKGAFAGVFEWLDAIQKQQVYGANTADTTLVQTSPSVAFAKPKLENN